MDPKQTHTAPAPSQTLKQTLAEPRPLSGHDAVPPGRDQDIAERMQHIDLNNTQSILQFGAGAQEKLTELTNEMLDGVRNKDLGPAGSALRNMVTTLRGFDAAELHAQPKDSWWQKLLMRFRPTANAMAKYEQVRTQVDGITDQLMQHEGALLKDIKLLDRLYDRSLDFYDELALYIEAGQRKLDQLDREIIPELSAQADENGDDQAVLRAQQLRDTRAARDDLERRLHDLKLTRQVTLQSLPSIRLVQENDKSLVNKIHSTLANTVPLWQTQLAQGLTIHRAREAAQTVRQANDLTNDLLRSNAENLRAANQEIRSEMERGVFDIESVQEANDQLIATIEDSLRLTDEGKKRRASAETELGQMAQTLREALSATQANPAVPRVHNKHDGS